MNDFPLEPVDGRPLFDLDAWTETRTVIRREMFEVICVDCGRPRREHHLGHPFVTPGESNVMQSVPIELTASQVAWLSTFDNPMQVVRNALDQLRSRLVEK